MNYKITTSVLLFSVLLTSCISTTMIQTQPSGAKVFVDGEYAGTTPLYYSDTKIIFSNTNLHFEKEGYIPFDATLRRNEELDAVPLIGGVIMLFPLLWILKYDAIHQYTLTPLVPETGLQPIMQNSEIEKQAPACPRISKLRELKQMLNENLISKEEYEKQKSKILEQNK